MINILESWNATTLLPSSWRMDQTAPLRHREKNWIALITTRVYYSLHLYICRLIWPSIHHLSLSIIPSHVTPVCDITVNQVLGWTRLLFSILVLAFYELCIVFQVRRRQRRWSRIILSAFTKRRGEKRWEIHLISDLSVGGIRALDTLW